jgi:hypothetical protein
MDELDKPRTNLSIRSSQEKEPLVDRDLPPLSKVKSAKSLPTVLEKNDRPFTIQEPLSRKPTLKRPYSFQDDSYGEILPPPPKKPRIQETPFAATVTATAVACYNNANRTNLIKPNLNSTIEMHCTTTDSEEEDQDVPANPCIQKQKQKRISSNCSSVVNDSQNSPKTKGCKSPHASHLTLVPLIDNPKNLKRTHTRENTNERFARLIKPFDPSSPLFSHLLLNTLDTSQPELTDAEPRYVTSARCYPLSNF